LPPAPWRSQRGWFITRSILGRLGGEPNYAATIASNIAEGRLNIAIDTAANDRSSLLYDMQTMRDRLLTIVADVRGSRLPARLPRAAFPLPPSSSWHPWQAR
jgi:methyl-accepting chemotaxis protein